TLVRAGLALALAGTLAALVLSARSAGSGRAAVLPEGASTAVIALDLSASISGPVYTRVATTLRGIVAANQAVGLVMFSDTAYELLPPNSPAGALLKFLRFFVPVRYSGGAPIFGESPWDQFSGGTRVAAGLAEARRALQRAHVAHGSILLVSDLDDASGDESALIAEALRLRQAHIPVRIVPLFPDPVNRRYFAAIFGQGAFVDPSAFSTRAGRKTQPVAATTPWALLGLGLVLVLLLAGNERFNTRLDLRAAA
ncbi:MAG TPA: vWA domain-containing protein, partial [Gaiellaceae bacterium]|nr:vWA domain-containing protein [Gaiellaceae bacterium]